MGGYLTHQFCQLRAEMLDGFVGDNWQRCARDCFQFHVPPVFRATLMLTICDELSKAA
jgi:hypothetical protein